MNIKEYEETEEKRKEFERSIAKAICRLFDNAEVCYERGYESDSIRRAIAINYVIRSIKSEMGVERMADNGFRTREIYYKYIQNALNSLKEAAEELYKIDEDQKW